MHSINNGNTGYVHVKARGVRYIYVLTLEPKGLGQIFEYLKKDEEGDGS